MWSSNGHKETKMNEEKKVDSCEFVEGKIETVDYEFAGETPIKLPKDLYDAMNALAKVKTKMVKYEDSTEDGESYYQGIMKSLCLLCTTSISAVCSVAEKDDLMHRYMSDLKEECDDTDASDDGVIFAPMAIVAAPVKSHIASLAVVISDMATELHKIALRLDGKKFIARLIKKDPELAMAMLTALGLRDIMKCDECDQCGGCNEDEQDDAPEQPEDSTADQACDETIN